MVVDDVGELFRADHQDVLGGAGADQGVTLGDAVAVAGAGSRDVEGRSRRCAEPVSQAGRGRRRGVRVGHGGDDDGAELGGLDAGLLQGLAGGALGHVDDADVGGGTVAGDDAGALADPLVRGIDPLADVLVGDDDVRAVGAESQDAGVLLDGSLLQRGNAHALSLQFCEECQGGGEVVRGLDGHRLDAGHAALGEAGKRAGRGQFDDAGDAALHHGFHAQVPADGAGDLGDQAVDGGSRRP